jgi:hypothetical protein
MTKENVHLINSALLATITVIISAIGGILVSSMNGINEKMDSLMMQTTINSERIYGHNKDSEEWKSRILALEKGESNATSDRITRSEALKAVEDLRLWVEKYYVKK